ncbi:unnamed protein product [Chrysodeixis includens]|uniref:FLYWCH-type domain-containing protein n=1 Tax=Chrysodeixis includens TaxID=689277 RepID=A0A9N8KWZ8_CHRIL|nr:unnamed protein product [Chrysodeixis includens]
MLVLLQEEDPQVHGHHYDLRRSYPEAFFTHTRFGNPLMLIGSYRFNKRSDSKGPYLRWVCTRKDTRCRATAHTLDNIIVMLNNTHNH